MRAILILSLFISLSFSNDISCSEGLAVVTLGMEASAERDGAESGGEEDETSDDGDGTDASVAADLLNDGPGAVLSGPAEVDGLPQVEERSVAETGAVEGVLKGSKELNTTLLHEISDALGFCTDTLNSLTIVELLLKSRVIAVTPVLVDFAGRCSLSDKLGLSRRSTSGLLSAESFELFITIRSVQLVESGLFARAGFSAHELVDSFVELFLHDRGAVLVSKLRMLVLAGNLDEALIDSTTEDTGTNSEVKDANDEGNGAEGASEPGSSHVGSNAAKDTKEDTNNHATESSVGIAGVLGNSELGLVLLGDGHLHGLTAGDGRVAPETTGERKDDDEGGDDPDVPRAAALDVLSATAPFTFVVDGFLFVSHVFKFNMNKVAINLLFKSDA